MSRRTPRRLWNTQPWPWPGDTGEDKAKRIAISYRQLVFDITQGNIDDPSGDLHRLDEHWAAHGQHWPRPRAIPYNNDDWLTAADLADALGKTPPDIYRWARRGRIQQRQSAFGTPEYSLASAHAYLLERRLRHAENQPQSQKPVFMDTLGRKHNYAQSGEVAGEHRQST